VPRNFAIKDECDHCGAVGPAIRAAHKDLKNVPYPERWVEVGERVLCGACVALLAKQAEAVAGYGAEKPDVPVG